MEDEELQRQLVETRAALVAKTKALEQAESAQSGKPPPPAAPSLESEEELDKAKSRIAELEAQLPAAEVLFHKLLRPKRRRADFAKWIPTRFSSTGAAAPNRGPVLTRRRRRFRLLLPALHRLRARKPRDRRLPRPHPPHRRSRR
jgi:hypothetical protein